MAKKQILLTKEGNVVALCDNIIENVSLGVKTIKRAADVEFDNELQVWQIISPDGEVLGSHPRRDEAIKMEIQIMNAKIKKEHSGKTVGNQS